MVFWANQAQVEVYDKRHQRFKDYEKEAQAIIDRLEFGADDTVIDIGGSTGTFMLYAASENFIYRALVAVKKTENITRIVEIQRRAEEIRTDKFIENKQVAKAVPLEGVATALVK